MLIFHIGSVECFSSWNAFYKKSEELLIRLKTILKRVWSALKTGLELAGCHVFGAWCIGAIFGRRFENISLRISNLWQSIKGSWLQLESLEEKRILQTENERLYLENQDLQARLLRASDPKQDQVWLEAQQELSEKNASLAHALTSSEARAFVEAQKCSELTSRLSDLSHELEAAKEDATYANQFKESVGQLKSRVKEIEKAFNSREDTPLRLDESVEDLLPVLLRQLLEAREKISEEKEELQGALKLRLSQCERILEEIRVKLEAVLPLLNLHRGWKDPIRSLILALDMVEEGG